MHNLKVENYVLFSGQTEDLSLGYSLSESSGGLLGRGEGGTRMHRSFCNKEQVVRTSKDFCWLKKTRHLKSRNWLFYIWEDARVWAHWNHSFDMHLSYLGPVSCVFSSWVSGCTIGVAAAADCLTAGTLFLSWAPSGLIITEAVMWWLNGCNIVCLLIREATFFHWLVKYDGKCLGKLCLRMLPVIHDTCWIVHFTPMKENTNFTSSLTESINQHSGSRHCGNKHKHSVFPYWISRGNWKDF